jgi:hypothetical protein
LGEENKYNFVNGWQNEKQKMSATTSLSNHLFPYLWSPVASDFNPTGSGIMGE